MPLLPHLLPPPALASLATDSPRYGADKKIEDSNRILKANRDKSIHLSLLRERQVWPHDRCPITAVGRFVPVVHLRHNASPGFLDKRVLRNAASVRTQSATSVTFRDVGPLHWKFNENPKTWCGRAVSQSRYGAFLFRLRLGHIFTSFVLSNHSRLAFILHDTAKLDFWTDISINTFIKNVRAEFALSRSEYWPQMLSSESEHWSI